MDTGRDISRWRQAMRAAERRRLRLPVMATQLALWTSICVSLAGSGYPRWRVWSFGALGVVGMLVKPTTLRLSPTPEVVFVFTLITASAALTGGLHSPMMVIALTPVIQAAIVGGPARSTFWAVAGYFLALVGLALLPPPWIGPPLPEPTYSAVVLLLICFAGANLFDHFAVLVGSFLDGMHQLVRSREEVATHALARARELELLSSRLSHELKNPLGAIKALAQLTARTATDGTTRERLAVLEAEADRIEDVLAGYLDFSRPLDALRPETIDLGELLDETLASLEGRAAAAEIALARRGAERIVADRRRLKEAFLNLVANAIEATPPQGSVTVELAPHGGGVQVRVCDTGRGMPPEVLARIGSPFFTTRDQGTGLGVLLARSVVAQHGGSLEYASAPGAGTVATVLLPRIPEERADGPCAAGR